MMVYFVIFHEPATLPTKYPTKIYNHTIGTRGNNKKLLLKVNVGKIESKKEITKV